jgi:CRISPR-associated protein Csb2
MSITIKLRFPAGKFHATPWGRHVNEGVAEWPPSPWRLLRALVAVWRRTRRDISTEDMKRLLEPLLAAPEFSLPPYRVAHTRHYMPWEKKGPLDRTMVFDTFVSVSRNDEVLMHWADAEVSSADQRLLSLLLENLCSFGRAESWVDAELTDDSREWNCAPSAGVSDPVSVFCPDPLSALSDEHFPVPDAKALKRGLKPEALLFDCPRWHLCLDTQIIHNERWPIVPGARWVNYLRPREFVAHRAAAKLVRRSNPTVARFVLDGPVLPLVTETLRVGEHLRCVAL